MNTRAWRRTWFQVHKWIGLLLAVLIVPLSLSGAALVWHDALDEAIHPSRYAVSGTTPTAPAAYVAAARAVLKPGERIAQLTLPVRRGPVVIAAATNAGDAAQASGPPVRTMIYLDPPTAKVLDVASSASGAVRFLHVLHGSLQVPGVGRTIVGWIGIFMMMSCFTGLWSWWPTAGSWARGLRWRRHRQTDANLHHLIGFWIALPLFVLSLTGAWIAFPGIFGAPTDSVPHRIGEFDHATMARVLPVATPAKPIEAVIAGARAVHGGGLRSIAWPTTRSPDWTVTFARGAVVKVADDTGTAVAAPARAPRGIARWMRRLHDGTDMGPIWRTIIFLGGIAPAVLAVTGLLMWWRARRWRADPPRR